MNRTELTKEFDRIIEVGIVNAHHDTEVLKTVREVLNALWEDMSIVRSCRTCCFADLSQCSPDADVSSEAFRRWRDCGGSLKQNWKWRFDDDTE